LACWRQLRELEADGLVERIVYPQVPPKVEYLLAERGRSLEAVLLALGAWGSDHIELFSKSGGPDLESNEEELPEAVGASRKVERLDEGPSSRPRNAI
jgi:DNA-binding HxlR family transcriptional regulator